MNLKVASIPTWANHWVNGFVQTFPTWAYHSVNGLMGYCYSLLPSPFGQNDWVNGLMRQWINGSMGWGQQRTRKPILFETCYSPLCYCG